MLPNLLMILAEHKFWNSKDINVLHLINYLRAGLFIRRFSRIGKSIIYSEYDRMSAQRVGLISSQMVWDECAQTITCQ